MDHITLYTGQPLPLPEPRVPVSTRLATMDDLGWIDQLQKQHSRELGFFPRAQMTGYIERGWVVVAEATKETEVRSQKTGGEGNSDSCLLSSDSFPLGYIAFRDRYLKRDELGAVFQLCVRKDLQRGYIGAALLKAAFERAAYGCRLFCCWCAQDLAANRFWEAMGFVPLAFRTGSKKRGSGVRGPGSGSERAASSRNPEPRTRKPSSARVHIFWQKRIRAGDVSTPWWFPSETSGGAVREDRIVLPIPPGVGWEQVEPVEVEDRGSGVGVRVSGEQKRRLPGPSSRNPTPETRTPISNNIATGGLRFTPPAPPKVEKPRKERPPKVKVKNDPKVAAAARELRDRWMEELNADPGRAMAAGKYDVARTLAPPPQPSPGRPGEGVRPMLAA